jgi:hypothetical protein
MLPELRLRWIGNTVCTRCSLASGLRKRR